MFVGYAMYIRQLIDEYTVTYIHRLIDECIGLCSSIETILLSFEEYNPVIFFGTHEYKIIEKCTIFSVSRHVLKNACNHGTANPLHTLF
jgi:hypothetical protein